MSSSSSSNSPCAACKFLRRKCTQGCGFAPYFPPDNPQKFASVHRVFGASNVAKLLNELPPVQREDAVNSLAYEAESRLRDPVYGCVGHISVLQSRLRQIQHDLENAKKELSTYIGAAAYGPILPPYQSQFAIPFHHHGVVGSSSSSMNLFGMNSQMLIRDQQQQMVEAQQLAVAAAAVAAREQEMLRNLEQQQQQQQYSGGGYVNVNQMGGNGGGAAEETLVMPQQQQQFENNAFQVQQQQQQQQLLQLHQFSDQTNSQTVGIGLAQQQVQRPTSEERGMDRQ